jgi:hypothetical protein
MPDNLTPNPFPSGKGNRIYLSESEMASSPFCDLILGAGVTPAQGSVKPTAGFTFNQVNCPAHTNAGVLLRRSIASRYHDRTIPYAC